jgi:N-hydroxyarylamine O-acetyltransferase
MTRRWPDARPLDTSGLDLDAYCRRIGFAGPRTATRATLEQLVARHAAAIPFENIEVLARRVPALDTAGLQRKMVAQRRGGYCFEQNGLLRRVLQAFGFDAHPLEARIRSGIPADVVTGRTHLLTRVVLDGADHLADVGCGVIAPVAPLALASSQAQPAATGRYRLVDAGPELLLQALAGDDWQDGYAIQPGAPAPVDAEIGNWWVATHPTSMLANHLLVGRALDDGRLRLFDRKLSVFRPETAAPHEQVLQSRAELADALADGFGLDVTDADLDAVMTVLDRLPG